MIKVEPPEGDLYRAARPGLWIFGAGDATEQGAGDDVRHASEREWEIDLRQDRIDQSFVQRVADDADDLERVVLQRKWGRLESWQRDRQAERLAQASESIWTS